MVLYFVKLDGKVKYECTPLEEKLMEFLSIKGMQLPFPTLDIGCFDDGAVMIAEREGRGDSYRVQYARWLRNNIREKAGSRSLVPTLTDYLKSLNNPLRFRESISINSSSDNSCDVTTLFFLDGKLSGVNLDLTGPAITHVKNDFDIKEKEPGDQFNNEVLGILKKLNSSERVLKRLFELYR